VSISFFHIASIYPKSTKFVIENVRKYHPDNYYFLAIDGERNEYISIIREYDLDYVFYKDKLGGPIPPYGYNLDTTIRFLKRFYEACVRCNTSHIIMMEDDVLVTKSITVHDDWEHACADTKIGNIIPDKVHDIIEQYCGKMPTFKQYGAGGGSIFKVSTFIRNYDRIIRFFNENFNSIQQYYPTIGYIDCFMDVCYFICGKDYSVNPYRTDTHNHFSGFDYEEFIQKQSDKIEIINNYKKYYYE
jgi:hypothetical protein